MATQLQPLIGVPRIPSPTPTAADAQGDIYLSRTRFRHLSVLNAQSEIEGLLQQWDDPTSDTNFGSCGAIAAAIKNGHKQLLKYLADRGFSLLEPGAGDAACEYAVRTGDLEILELLVEHGWDPKVNTSGKSQISLVLGNIDVAQWFLTHGADPNAWCSFGVTAVTQAARTSSLAVLKLLISHGGNVIDTDAVAQAATGDVNGFPDRLEIVDYLIDLGAPVDAYQFGYSGSEVISFIDIYGMETGLQLAVRGGRKEMVELLLRHGADKTKKSLFIQSQRKGETAIEIAEATGLTKIAALLKE